MLEQFLRTTDGAIGAIHAPYWCDDNVAAAAGYAAEALWKNICKHNSTAPVTHDCYLKLFYLQGRELAPRDWTVMLDEAQDADPVILGLLERHKGARIIVGDKYQQLYQWRGAVNALSRMRSDSAELSLTRTFRFGPGAAEWANRVLEIIGEKLRIIPAPHRTTVSIEEKSVTIDALLARTNAGTLDEAIQGLERRRKVHVMGGADPLIRLIRGAWDLHRGKSASGELAMFASLGRTQGCGQRRERRFARRPCAAGSRSSDTRIAIGRFFRCAGNWKHALNLPPLRRSRSVPFTRPKALNGRGC